MTQTLAYRNVDPL